MTSSHESRIFRMPQNQITIYLSLFLISWTCLQCSDQDTTSDLLTVMDPDLDLQLVAASPDIGTPIGLTIDSRGLIYLLETHTHTPLSDYAGPAFDRIMIGEEDQGTITWRIYADSILDGMNLEVDNEDRIYLACKDRILRFTDTDQDGVSDQREQLMHMEASGDIYDHAGIMGIRYRNGTLYISRGNVGSLRWEMRARDGSSVRGYGDGGNVVKMSNDGENISEVATGFWNPFDLAFNTSGHLLLADNDPDSRGPNRLVNIVQGGDYGYKSLYGGSGIHPFLAWNGELPGTLPIASPLGEAPCGVVNLALTNWGASYDQSMAAAIWEENSIVSIDLPAREGVLNGTPEILVRGGKDFHPVSFAIAPNGDLYFTDWMIRQYPVHDQGRLWKLAGRASKGDPDPLIDLTTRNTEDQDEYQLLLNLQSNDPFLRAASRYELGQRNHLEDWSGEWIQSGNEEQIIKALLTLIDSKDLLESVTLKDLVQHDNSSVQNTTLRYIATYGRRDMLPVLESSLRRDRILEENVPAYLATMRHLQEDFIDELKKQENRQAKNIERSLPEDYVISKLSDRRIPATVRATLVRNAEDLEENASQLQAILESDEEIVQSAILEKFTQIREPSIIQVLRTIIDDQSLTEDTRSKAVVALSFQSDDFCSELSAVNPEDRTGFFALELHRSRCTPEEEERRPTSDEEWRSMLAKEHGNKSRGEWIFRSKFSQCQSCHQVNGWGSTFGPDLSHIGASKSKEQIINSILDPSELMSPEWQGWYVIDTANQYHAGRQIDIGFKNVELLMPDGSFKNFSTPREYGMADISLMPDGLENNLRVRELADLVAYLISLK